MTDAPGGRRRVAVTGLGVKAPAGTDLDSYWATLKEGRSCAGPITRFDATVLPEPFRLVFILREVQECSIEETAASLALKPQTVKTRLHRARRLLRERLDDQLGQAMTGAFPFLGRRCERITAAVLKRLGMEAAPAA